MKRIYYFLIVILFFGGTSYNVSSGFSTLEKTYLLSKSSSGQLGEYSPQEYRPGTSYDGRFTVFATLSSYSIWDTGYTDVYLHDVILNQTFLISRNNLGFSGNSESRYPSISGDGTKIVFSSSASDLVPNDNNGKMEDVFLYDVISDEISIISVSTNGEQKNESSIMPSISDNGRYVAFASTCDFFDTTSRAYQIYVRDLLLGSTVLASISNEGTVADHNSYSPSVADDGSVVFITQATTLIDFDTNNLDDVYHHNLQTGDTQLVSISSTGGVANNNSYIPDISSNGQFVAFCSNASNLVANDYAWTDCFLRDLLTHDTHLVSVTSEGFPAGSGSGISISSDGSFLAFEGNLMYLGESYGGLPLIFVLDINTNEYYLASMSNNFVTSNGDSLFPEISGDGHSVAFVSYGKNLFNGDTNNVADVFLHKHPFVTLIPIIQK